MSGVDWSVFDHDPKLTCYCRCGAIFRSHGKYLAALGKMVTREPCPGCGKSDDLRQTSSDPERYIMQGGAD